MKAKFQDRRSPPAIRKATHAPFPVNARISSAAIGGSSAFIGDSKAFRLP